MYATSSKRPIQHKTFMESNKARQSYWARWDSFIQPALVNNLSQICRNFVGWPRWSSCRPNSAHLALAAWERQGRVQHVVTQNVDQLHYKVILANIGKMHNRNKGRVPKCGRASWDKFSRQMHDLLLLNSQDDFPGE